MPRILLVVIIALLMPPWQVARAQDETAVQVQEVRVGLTPGRTRVVFDLSGETSHELSTDANAGEVTVVIGAGGAVLPVQVPGDKILGIRVEPGPDQTIRYVFSVAANLRAELFPLGRGLGRGERLVLDLYETEPDEQPPAADNTRVAEAPPPARPSIPPRPQRNRRASAPPPEVRGEWSGHIDLELRLFPDSPAHPGQERQHGSIAIEPEYHLRLAESRQQFGFRPFARYDVQDSERSHVDLREAYWQIERGPWLAKVGVDVEFWGVAESQHLVDIINQTDAVENIDNEDKLGQPMLNIDYSTGRLGTLQAWILPWFRERTFPGRDGRLRSEPPVDTDEARFDSADGDDHVDLAVRWSHYIGDWDIGIAHFSGTDRRPLLLPNAAGDALLPYYLQVEQTSIDVQATLGDWLWKLEALYNDNKVDSYAAAVGGFEYTQYGVGGGDADIGWLAEYHYDERDERAPSALARDLYLGLRYSGNDIAGSTLLAGVIVDLDNDSQFFNIEAARRWDEAWVVTLEARLFSNIDRADPLYYIRRDDYLELQLQRFF